MVACKGFTPSYKAAACTYIHDKDISFVYNKDIIRWNDNMAGKTGKS